MCPLCQVRCFRCDDDETLVYKNGNARCIECTEGGHAPTLVYNHGNPVCLDCDASDVVWNNGVASCKSH